jgi:hypothetical protein
MAQRLPEIRGRVGIEVVQRIGAGDQRAGGPGLTIADSYQVMKQGLLQLSPF